MLFPKTSLNRKTTVLKYNILSSQLNSAKKALLMYTQKHSAISPKLNIAGSDLKISLGMINNFGQTPCQLLKEPHPKRLSPEEAILAKKKRKPPSLMATMPDWKPYLLDLGTLSTDKDPVVYINAPGWRRHFSQNSPDSTVITISSSGIVGIHQWIFQDNKTCYNLDVDPTFLTSGKFFFLTNNGDKTILKLNLNFYTSAFSQNMFQIFNL